MKKNSILGMAALGAAMVLGPTVVQAGDSEFCHEYANAAIVQVRGALNNAGCRSLTQGARWSSDWRVHYNWCRGTSVHEAETERNIRRGILTRCTAH
jgi:hypothetical protein